jgi:hypothetical protein
MLAHETDTLHRYVFDPTLTRPAYTPSYTLANITTGSNTLSGNPAPSTTNTGAIAGGVVGGVIIIAVATFLIWFCIRRRRRSAAAALSPNPPFSPASELPTYDESKHVAAVEVSRGEMMGFTPYHVQPHGLKQPYGNSQDPAELQAEAEDQVRPLSVTTVSVDEVASPTLGCTGLERKPVGTGSTSRRSEVSDGSGRLSRQSEVSSV